MLHTLPRLVLLLALTLAPAGAVAPAGPLCGVTGTWTPAAWSRYTLGFPRIGIARISLRPECPPNAVAYIRFRTIAGQYRPEAGFYILSGSARSITRTGVPEYYSGEWQAASGLTYPFRLRGAR